MLKALLSAGIEADVLIGSSVGAINAAYFAGSPDLGGVERLAEIWCSLDRKQVFPVAPIRALLSIFSSRHSLASPLPLRRLLERKMPYRTLETARVPVHVVATRLSDGAEVVLSTGPVVPALMASAAIPGVFPPVPHDGDSLVDGGIAANTPLSSALRLGARRVVVLPTGSPCAANRPPRGAIGVAIHSLNLLILWQLLHDLERLSGRAELIVVPPLCPLETSVYDFSRTAELIERAETSTRSWIARGGLRAGKVPGEMQPHHHRERSLGP